MAYTVVTLADLKIGMTERWDGAVFWTDEEARLAINEALRDWNLLVGRWTTTLVFSTVAGIVEYPLGAAILYGTRVKVGAQPLIPTSIPELDLGRPSWRGETIVDGGDVPAAPTLWAPQSLQQIVIWPATLGGTADLQVIGVAATPVLIEDADTVDLGEELHDPLLDYALHVAAFKEGGARWAATLPYFTTFLQMAADENALLKASKAYRRYAGLDRRRDLVPTRQPPTQIDSLAQSTEEQKP